MNARSGNDLTQGSINSHIGRMTGMMLFGMLFQSLYYLVDLYFVARVGPQAVAAVSLVGNLMMITVALTQALTVGTTSLIAQAIGRKDMDAARRVFNQSQVLATAAGLVFIGVIFAVRNRFAEGLSADEGTAQAAVAYLNWFVPAMGLQFLMVAMGAALRGAGEVKAPMQVQVIALLANIVLAPVLIAGYGTGRPMGVAGAGLATFLSIVLAAVLLLTWVRRRHDLLDLDAGMMRPDLAMWKRMLGIGLPSGAEFLLMSAYSMLIYGLIKSFGTSAQAGFGVGMRIMQTGFMPALAVAFSIAPIAGQNLGAGRIDRVREVFKAGVVWVSLLMIAFIGLVHLAPNALLSPFAKDPAVIAVGAQMLAILSTNFLASGVIQVASGMFQAIGNTLPSLIASASRIGLFVVPALWLSRQPDFQLTQLWWLSVASVIAQLLIVLWLLRREFARKLAMAPVVASVVA